MDVHSAGEAIRALCIVVDDFENFVRESSLSFQLLVRDNPIPISELEIGLNGNEFHIVPVISGAKSDGVEFVTGAAMLALAVVTMGGSAIGDVLYGSLMDAGMSAGAISMASNFVGAMGVSMMLGGISRMLTTAPQTQSNTAVFSSISNTVAQGVPIPCAYGDFYVTAPLISEKIVTQTLSSIVNGVSGNGGGGGGNGGNWSGSQNTGGPVSSKV